MKKIHPAQKHRAKTRRLDQRERMLVKGHEKAQIERKQLKGKYNGVIGEPPKWLPNPLQEEFYATRNFLLRKYTPEIILQHMESRKKLLDFQGVGSTYSYPLNRESNLDSLLYIKKIIKLGKTKGMETYLGESGQEVVRDIVLVERQKQIAKKPRTDDLKKLILKILDNYPEATFPEFLKELKKEVGKGIIDTITDEKIEWTTKKGKIKDTSIKALKKRFYEAKKSFITLTG